jgi:hypothetical protein
MMGWFFSKDLPERALVCASCQELLPVRDFPDGGAQVCFACREVNNMSYTKQDHYLAKLDRDFEEFCL